jgi:hypothetical protein
MGEMPKRVKRALREVAMQAHEEELRRLLLPLADAFDQWRAGRLSSGELVDMIHQFHQGPARELFKKYNYASLELAVAHAVVTGVIDRGQLPGEILDHLRRAIQFYEEEARTS